MRVLHLISGGDTGGAKTHIMALLSALKDKAHVTLGVFIDDVFLEEAKKLSIPTVLFEQKNRFDLSVINEIARFIEDEHIDLVHCHGARANFNAIFLKRKVKIPFVTTVHSDYRLDFKGVFYKQLIFKNLNSFALRRFNNYIAVSDNFKNMLLERGFHDKNIDVVYNGIDLEKREQMVDKDEFCDRYGLRKDSFKFGILARLDQVKDHKTFLRAAAEFLKDRDADFLLGGSGILEGELKEFCRELGIEDKVYFLGEIHDPFSFLNCIDVNVLTSISESFPYVILEGGKLNKPMLATEVGGIPRIVIDGESGFTFKPGDYESLSRKFIELYEDRQLVEKLGGGLHKIIDAKYSSEVMAKKHIDIYKKVILDKTLVFSGFYGFDNQGDDAILEAITSEIKKQNPYLKLKVLSNNPVKTSEIYDLQSVYRFNPFKLIKAMKEADMLVSGGGSLLQDITSSRSLWYYLFVIAISKKLKRKTVIYANGVGPIDKKFNKKLTKKTLNNIDYISLRDRDSFTYLLDMGLEEKDLRLRSDPVFLLEPDLDGADLILKGLGLSGDFTVLNLRPWKDEENFVEKISRVLVRFMDEGNKILLLPMHLSQDIRILKKIEDLSRHKNLYSYYNEMPVRTLMGIIKMANSTISMRLHGLIYSVAVETRPFALSYDPKVDGFMKDINSKYILDINNFDENMLYDMLLEFIYDDDYLKSIEKDEENRKALAEKNVHEVLNIIGEDNA